MSRPLQFRTFRFRHYRKTRLALAKLLLLASGSPALVYSQFTYSEDFTNSTAPGWNFYQDSAGTAPGPRLTSGATPTTGDPELTAGDSVIDPSGQGWLRLATATNNQANAVSFDTPIPSAGNRVTVSFSANLWGGNGADGLTMFLYDASKDFDPGGFGGSLGYANRDGTIGGLAGAYVAVGLDAFGNFSNPTETRNGGVGFVPNAVVIRGPDTGAVGGQDGYNYLAGTSGNGIDGRDYTDTGGATTLDAADGVTPTLPYQMQFTSATDRPNQSTQYRRVEATLDENSQFIIRMQFGEDGLWRDLLNVDLSSFTRPEQLRIGFTGGTGGSTGVYEIGGILRIDATAGSETFMWDNDEGPASQIWGTSVTNPQNWFGNTNPTLKSNIIFNSAYINEAQNIDLRGSDKVITNLYFAGPDAYTLSTTESRKLIFDSKTAGGLTTLSLTSDTGGDTSHEIAVNVLMNQRLDVNNNIVPAFTISGDIDTNGNALGLKGYGTTVVSGDISGSGSLTKTDSGTTTLSGANTYTGLTTVSGGTLRIESANALGSTTAGTTVSSGGTLALAGPGTTFAAEALILNGTGASGVGALQNAAGTNTLAGTVSLASDTAIGAAAGTTLTLQGVVSGTAATNDLAKVGDGTLVLAAVNTYQGTTTVSAGTLQISNENNLGANPAAFNAAQLTLDGGTLRTAGSAVTLDDTNRGVTIGASGGTFETSTALTVATAVTGTGTLTKTGASTLTLSGTNTHSGAVNINAGTLATSGGSALGDTSAVTVATGATFNLSAANETIGSLAGAGATTLGTRTLTLGGDNTSTTYSGVASGTGGLTKTGTGTLTLSGANTFTGATTISAGTVSLGAAGVLADTSSLALNGGTLALAGNFSETLGALTLGANSTIDFNNATSTLTFASATRTAGTLTVDDWAGAAFGGGNSRLVVSSPLSGFSTGANGEFTQINFTGWGAGAVRLASGEVVPYTGGTVYTYALAGGGNWNVDNNWSDNGLPANADPASGQFASAAGDTAILGSAATANATVNLNGANRTLGYLIVNDDNTYTVTGNTLNFDVNAGQAQLVNQGSGGLTLNSAVTLADALTVTQTGSGLVDINGNLSGTNQNLVVAGDGSGFVRLDGSVATGTGTLTKNGASTLVLSNAANSFTGAITVNGGVLQIASEGALGSTASTADLTLNGATLRVSDELGAVNTVTVATSLRNLVLGSAGGTIETIDNLVWDNGISGSGSLTKTGAATLTFEDPTTFTGAFNINEGTVRFAAGDNRLADTVAVTIASGATLDVNTFTDTIGSLTGAGTLTNASGTAGTDTLTFGGLNTTTVFSGTISDNVATLALTKTGTGTTTLSGNNSHDGLTTVSAGTLVAASSTALGATTGDTTISSGATLALQGGIAIAAGEDLTLGGTGVGSGGALRNLSGANSLAGTLTLNANTSLQSDAGTLAISGNINGNAAGRTLTVAGAGDTTLTGTLGANIGTNAANSLIKTGTGTLTLGGAGTNTYVGTTAINAGTVVAAKASALGATGAGNTTTVASGATLALSGGFTTAETLSLAGQGASASGALRNDVGNNTVTGNLTLASETFIGVAAGTTLTQQTGVVSGGFGLSKVGDGTLVLAGANTYTGTTAVNAGTLEVRNNAALGTTASPTVVSSGATVAFNGASLSIADNFTLAGTGVGTAGALQTTGGSGSTTLTGTVTLNGNTTVGTGSGTTLALAGAIAEESGFDYGLLKTGEGTLVLSGVNTYQGATTVRAGTLRLDANAPVSANGALGSASSAVQLGDASSGSAAIALLAGPSELTIARDISVNNFGAGTTIGGDNPTGTTTFSGAVTLSKDVTLTAVSGGTTAFTGSITGAGAVAKTDTGTVILSGDNTYTGATTVSAGTLVAASSGALGATGAATTVASGATLGIQNNITLAENLTVNGSGASSAGALRNVSGDNTISGAVTLGSAATFGSSAGTLTVSGPVSGAQALTTTGAGAITFTGANTASSTLTVSGGTTTLANTTGQAFGSVTGVTVNSGATLALGAANQLNDAATLTLAGGTFSAGGFDEQMRQLVQTSASTISFLNDGGALRFNGVTASTSGLGSLTGVLTIDSWGGALSGGGAEQLVVYTTGTQAALNTAVGGGNIAFTDWGNATTIARTDLGAGFYEIVPILTGTYWDVNGNGNWNAANWDNGNNTDVTIGDSATTVAILGDIITGTGGASTPLTVDPTITINSDRMVSRIVFENSADRNYTLIGNRRLEFESSTGQAQIMVSDDGSHTIANTSTNRVESNLLITNNSGAATGLTISANLQIRDNNNDFTFNGSGTTLVSGVLSSNGTTGNDLIKTGSGTLILSGVNTYSGNTTLRNGTLDLRNDNAATTTGTIFVNDASTSATMDTTLVLGSAVTVSRPVTVNNFGDDTTLGSTITSGTATFSGTVTLNKDVALSAASGGTTAFSGVMAGTGGIEKIGAGTVILSGANTNTFTGDVTVTAGTLEIAKTGGADRAINNGADVTVASGATLRLDNGLAETIGSLAGAGSVTQANATATTLTTGGNGASTTFSGVITDGAAGNLALTKDGTGTFTLSGANSYDGLTTVQQGTLVAANNTALGNTTGDTTVVAGATLALANNITVAAGEALTLNAGTTSNALYNQSGTNTYAGTVALVNSGNTVRIGAAAGSTLTVSGVVSESGGATGFTKTDLGTVVLSGANTYTGAVNVAAGTLVVANNAALGTTAAGTSVQIGATLGFQDTVTVAAAESITLAGTNSPTTPSLKNLAGTNTVAGNILLTGGVNTGVRVDVNSGSTLVLNGAITQQTNNNTFTKTGDGQLTLGGTTANTFGGDLIINEGTVLAQKTAGVTATGNREVFIGDGTGAANTATLRLGASNQIANTSDITIRTDGRLDLQANSDTVQAVTMNGGAILGTGTLTLGGNLTFNGVGTATSSVSSNLALGATDRIIQVGNNGINGDSDMAVSGVISGTGQTLRKTDLGTLELTGTSSNTFTGGLVVEDGVVLLNKTAGLNALGGGSVTLGDGLLGANTAIVRYGSNNQLPDSTDLVFKSDGLLDMNGRTDRVDEIDSFVAGNGHILIGTGQLIVGTNNGDSVYSGLLTGTTGGVLEKIGTGTLTFSDADAIRADRVMDFGGELKLEAGTLALDNITLNVDTLRLTGDSVIDFGGSSILNVNTLIIELASGETTLITSWSEFVDYFYAQEFYDGEGGPLVPFDTRGQAPQNRIVFDGWVGNNTWWQSPDNQINPVPEPSSYGLLALGGLVGATLLRRRKRAAL